MNVVVIDLGCGNIRSLKSALTYLGVPHATSTNADSLPAATHVILPGVGAFDAAMSAMSDLSLLEPLRDYARQRRPLLGVCLGMQLLFEGSEEGRLPGLGVMVGRCVRLTPDPDSRRKVPHVGFSAIAGYRPQGLFNGLGAAAHFYFTHSYAVPALAQASNVATCVHTQPFVAAFQDAHICGAQFHPEKSQSSGLRLLSNFMQLA